MPVARQLDGIVLKFIIIDFDPESIRVLQIDLFDPVGPDLGTLAATRVVPVFYMGLVEVFEEFFQRGYAEGEMDVDVVRDIFLGAGDNMQLGVFSDLDPDMFSIVKGLGYFLELQGILIEISAFLEVYYKDGRMIEMRALCADGSGGYQYGGQGYGQQEEAP
jgi:hypothetical protein